MKRVTVRGCVQTSSDRSASRQINRVNRTHPNQGTRRQNFLPERIVSNDYERKNYIKYIRDKEPMNEFITKRIEITDLDQYGDFRNKIPKTLISNFA